MDSKDGPGDVAGRGLPKTPEPRAQPPGASSAASTEGPADQLSPFARYTPDSASLDAHTDAARRYSLGVFAIVAGIGAVVMGGLAVVVLMVGGVYLVTGEAGPGALAGGGPAHVTDTGHGQAVPSEPRRRRRRTGGGGVAAPRGPKPGPATVIVPTDMAFLSMELDCPGGFSRRGRFQPQAGGATMRATVQAVPAGVSCRVTFQGSEPAKTRIAAGQTRRCTFNPTVCKTIR
ncbi:MAG: hypothetical protein KTR31_29305 [Myxococcales bacterium]|nr:hypothetical protein [Myxococcales bacterium]